MTGGNSNDSRHPNVTWSFFSGVIEGAIGRPEFLFRGSVRTASWIGLRGQEPRSNTVFHNYLTYQAVLYGFRHFRVPDVDPAELARMWANLPRERQVRMIDWGASTAGGITGGTMVNLMISRQLTRFIPRTIVCPTMIFIGCQGYMAAIWRDQW